MGEQVAARIYKKFAKAKGLIAQLGERLLCTQEVSGSIPLGSIESKDSSIVH